MRTLVTRIILPYAVFSALWILLSDWFIAVWIPDESERTRVSIYKGWAFVLITSLLLFLLLRIELAMRRRAQKQARESEHRYREVRQRLELAVSGAGVGMWDWDLETQALYLSPEWKRQLGYEPDEIPSSFDQWEDRLHPEDRERAMEAVRAFIEGRTGDYELEHRLRHKDGSYRWMLARGMLERDPDGSPRRMLGCQVDITQRKKSEAEAVASKELAEAASRTKDHFLASLSHELRTPLTPVLALLSSLQHDPKVSAELGADIAMMRHNVEMEARLIDDLLDLTRISRGSIHLNLGVCDAHELIRHAVEICRHDITARNQVLTVDLAAAAHHVNGDPVRLEQVFWNLLKNAVKFTPPLGSITVRSSNDSNGVLKVEVTDTGIGIEPQAMSRLFEAFQQVHNGTLGHLGGLGLGLAISRSLIKLHGGSIVAASEGNGRGATFTVTLAAFVGDALVATAPAPAAVAAEPSPATRPARARERVRILLVEDDAATAAVLARLLRRLGHVVATAATMREAMEAAALREFDLLLSDIGLPDGSGLEIMRQLKPRGLRGIALSGYGMDSDLRNSEEAGFAMHLVKPVDFAELARAIEQTCSDISAAL